MSTLTDALNLEGKVAIVTGGASGLGRAFALALAEAGADVGLGGRRLERLEATRAEIEAKGRTALAIATDVTKPEECRHLADETRRQLGAVDILVNSAGIASVVPALREEPDNFRQVLETNLMGSYWMAQACAAHMAPGASIINVGSVLGQTSVSLPVAAYASSKAGLLALTRDLAQQWGARRGIRVNVVVPGFFTTEMTDDISEERLAQIITRVPLGRMGEAAECANAVVFLASDAASFITGTSLVIDGGLLAG